MKIRSIVQGYNFNPLKYNQIVQDQCNSKRLYDGPAQQGLDWYDYGARFYDPALGRFHTIDPLAESFDNQSPFVYAMNNPILLQDFLGMGPDTTNTAAAVAPPENSDTPDDPPKSEASTEDGSSSDSKSEDSSDGETTNATTIAPPIPWYVVLGETTVAVSVRVLGTFAGMLTLQGDTPQNRTYKPPPKELPGFPGATKVKPRTGRARWRLPNGDIAEWDSQHGEVEVYDKTGKNHKGAFNPETGKREKPPKKVRRTKK